MCALSLALTDFFVKKYSISIKDIELTLGRVFFCVPVLWFFVFFEEIKPFHPGLIPVLVIGIPLELLALSLYTRALRVSPLSAAVPFLSFTPVFLLVTAPLILKEAPSIPGIAGVIVIVCGAYLLNISLSKGFFFPFKQIIKEQGSYLMLLVAFIFSITANLGKIGVTLAGPAFFGALYFTVLVGILTTVIIIKYDIRTIFKKEFLIIGFFSALMILFHMLALKEIFVTYMIAVKRVSLLFGIVMGVIFFKEKGYKQKIAGGIVMVCGIAIITFLG